MVEGGEEFKNTLATKIKTQTVESGIISGIDNFFELLENEILKSVEDSTGCILYMRDRPSVTWDWEEDYIDGQDWSPLEHKVLNEVWDQIKTRLPVKNNAEEVKSGGSETFYSSQEEFNQHCDETKLTCKVNLILGLQPQITCIQIGLRVAGDLDVDIAGLNFGLHILKIHQTYGEPLYTLDLGEDNAKYRFQLLDFNDLVQ